MAKKTFTLDPVKLLLGALISGFGIILIHTGMATIGEATSGKSKKSDADIL
jgi:hypothetical protein